MAIFCYLWPCFAIFVHVLPYLSFYGHKNLIGDPHQNQSALYVHLEENVPSGPLRVLLQIAPVRLQLLFDAFGVVKAFHREKQTDLPAIRAIFAENLKNSKCPKKFFSVELQKNVNTLHFGQGLKLKKNFFYIFANIVGPFDSLRIPRNLQEVLILYAHRKHPQGTAPALIKFIYNYI